MTRKAKIEKITFDQWAGLQTGRIARIYQGHAALECAKIGEERKFIMRGQTGTHTLLCDATDLDRLNAHWVVFAGHDMNRFAP